MKILRAYKYRLHPTPEQEARLSAWVAAVRAVYNAARQEKNTCTDECPYDFVGDRRFNAIRQTPSIGGGGARYGRLRIKGYPGNVG